MAQEKIKPDAGLKGCRITVSGVVQGVGFRPFVYHLAGKWGVAGSVQNAVSGVVILAEGLPDALDGFADALRDELPALARIKDYQRVDLPPVGYTQFSIITSATPATQGKLDALIPPDVAICRACAQDVFNPSDRHYRYPFTNCTNCGPRFTIIKSLPYDRPRTAMAAFPMCGLCAGEYHNPEDRRFHAQPVACPDCGPQVTLTDKLGNPVEDCDNWPETAGALLAAGKILALKGLGGFHLVCDAHNRQAVITLRQRKGRKAKPFAVMCRDMATVQKYCRAGEQERALLTSPAAPIVILAKNFNPTGAPPPFPLPEELAPGADTLGVMLPYTPLHLLLCGASSDVLVMTSGNYSDLPLVKDNQQALAELGDIADYFLLHNREIVSRCDDSLLRIIDGERHFYRRSRGYVPEPLTVNLENPGIDTHPPRYNLPEPAPVTQPPDGVAPRRETGGGAAKGRSSAAPVILGIGGEMKNSFCLLKGNQAFMSAYIGEINCLEGEVNLRESAENLQRLVGAVPEIIAYDCHPNYASAEIARQMPAGDYCPVQHHHAHMAACMADNGLANQNVIGVILDGTGYGNDGNLWGFEILSGDYLDFERQAHLAYIPLPGGEMAVRQPWRTAAAYLVTLLGEWGKESARHLFPDKNIDIIANMIHNKINSPLSSGCGRLFDAIAAILGVCLENNYEGQAAVELGSLLPGELLTNPAAQPEWRPYPFELADGEIRLHKMLAAIVEAQRNNEPVSRIALRFHQTLASVVAQTVDFTARLTGCKQVALSGGAWQNPHLFVWSKELLTERGYRVIYHRQTPANDGGIALGQAMSAYWRWRKRCV